MKPRTIKHPLTQIDMFVRGENRTDIRFTRRCLSGDYRVTWHTTTTNQAYSAFYNFKNKFGKQKTRRLMNGKQVKLSTDTIRHTWKIKG